jgi:hypothetical protein
MSADEKITFKLSFNSVLPRIAGHDAMTIGQRIFVRGPRISAGLLAHEYAHVRQYRELGMIRFLIRYYGGLIRHGYKNHPMEHEAHEWADKNVARFQAYEAAPKRANA